MGNDGKQLEGLVAFVEEVLLPQGFEIKTNERVYEDGVQIAELDIQAKGKLGTTEIAWLIECRDRPSEGPAPNSWIEQLVGRRSRFGFNKVTAVSTTGFAEGAIKYAQKEGIELRVVQSLASEEFADWIGMTTLGFYQRVGRYHHATFNISPLEPEERHQELSELIKKVMPEEPFLRSIKTGEMVSIDAAFKSAIQANPHLSEQLQPNEPPIPLNLTINYPNDEDHFVVDAPSGAIRITQILFTGELSLKLTHIPVQNSQYSHLKTGEVISQSAAFPFTIDNKDVSLEMHRIPDSEFTHVILRTSNTS